MGTRNVFFFVYTRNMYMLFLITLKDQFIYIIYAYKQ